MQECRTRSAGCTQPHADHVGFQVLVVAHPGIETGGEHVDQPVLGHHLQADARMPGQEGADQRWQQHPGDDGGHIESQAAHRTLALGIDGVQCAPHLAQRGGQPLQQTLAGRGGGHAAGGAVQQPHIQFPLQPAYRVAQGRGRHAAHIGGAAKAAGFGHGGEGHQVIQIHGLSIVRLREQAVVSEPDYRTAP